MGELVVAYSSASRSGSTHFYVSGPTASLGVTRGMAGFVGVRCDCYSSMGLLLGNQDLDQRG